MTNRLKYHSVEDSLPEWHERCGYRFLRSAIVSVVLDIVDEILIHTCAYLEHDLWTEYTYWVEEHSGDVINPIYWIEEETPTQTMESFLEEYTKAHCIRLYSSVDKPSTELKFPMDLAQVRTNHSLIKDNKKDYNTTNTRKEVL